LTRNFDPDEEFRQVYSRPGPFTAIPSICNQRSLDRLTEIGTIQRSFEGTNEAPTGENILVFNLVLKIERI
jgi:hypothetical protein